MSCTQTISGLAKDCSASMGGVKKVYIAPFDEGLTIAITTGAISTFTPSGAVKFNRFNFHKGQASLTKTSTIGADGSVSIASQLVMNFRKMDATKRAEMMALLKGEVQVIVVDNNDVAWFLGYNNPVTPVGSQNGQTGQAFTDANQYSITLQDDSAELPYSFADATVYSAAIAEVS